MAECKFHHIKGYEDIPLPTRATADSAGYDLCAAEDITIPSYWDACRANDAYFYLDYSYEVGKSKLKDFDATGDLAPTLVPTGISCELPHGYYLSISARSSLPLKNLLIVANAPGIIDADYFGNPDNQGHIYVQLLNLAPWNVIIPRGTKIAQCIIQKYETTDDDQASGDRLGGFGSSDKK